MDVKERNTTKGNIRNGGKVERRRSRPRNRTDREGKMTVKYQVQESKSELEPLTQVGSRKDGMNPLDSEHL